MSCTHHNFEGTFNGLKLHLEVLDAGVWDMESLQHLLRGGDDTPRFKDGRIGTVHWDGVKGKAARKLSRILLSRIKSGRGVDITYLGGWNSGGSVWGPDGEIHDSMERDDCSYLEDWRDG
jgi:hypothetical protein